MTNELDIRVTTARLVLVPVTAAVARLALRDRGALAAAVGRSIGGEWPPEDLRDALAVHAGELERDRGARGWGVWMALLGAGGPLVGSAGFKGRPDRTGTVEIGYGIEAPFRRRGLATEAVTGLLRWAWERGAARVVAECDPSNAASIGVLRRVGMRRIGVRAGMWWWEVRRP
ncbi:MAG TPA: GNAT family N-acetyltransferase [Actinomycetota bacterium]|nr:GNAT family N-acetyltransferase [Actinomycetota bacterium]